MSEVADRQACPGMGKVAPPGARMECSEISVGSVMLDRKGLEAATDALREMLAAEAQEQGASYRRFPDGRVSIELEWINPAAFAEAVVQTYLDNIGDGARRRPSQGERPVLRSIHAGLHSEQSR